MYPLLSFPNFFDNSKKSSKSAKASAFASFSELSLSSKSPQGISCIEKSI